MRRSLLYGIIAAALTPAASLWAASPIADSPNQFANQVAYQAYQIQCEADSLQAYVRSGAHDRLSVYAYAWDMGDNLNKLSSAVNQMGAQAGTAAAHQQADKMKVEVAGLRAMIAGTVQELDPNSLALHADTVFADTNNIEQRGNMLRSAAQSLTAAR